MREPLSTQQICRKALLWIGMQTIPDWHQTRQTLPIEALREALSVSDECNTLEEDHLIDEDLIQRYCGSFIRISVNTSKFEFAHFTAMEYLKRLDPNSELGFFHWCPIKAVTSYYCTSARFLTLSNFAQKPNSNNNDFAVREERNRLHPFHSCAAMFLAYPYFSDEIDLETYLPEDGDVSSLLRKLFSPMKNGTFVNFFLEVGISEFEWRAHFKTSGSAEEIQKLYANLARLVYQPTFSTLHAAAIFAIPQICTFLLLKGSCANTNLISPVGPPLHLALKGLGCLEQLCLMK